MSGMKIGKKIEIEILNLKFLTETLDIAEQELKDGSDDLHFRLSYFRKRVAIKDKEKYDEFFFGQKSPDIANSVNDANQLIHHEDLNELPVMHQKKDPWLKKIYRKIVSTTHPDKFVNFSVDSLKQKYLNIYRKAVTAWEKENDDQILLLAYESEIKIDNPKSLPILREGIKKKSGRLQEIKTLLAYQWYHVPAQNRGEALENYLRELGYEFTTGEIEKVVNLARKRKVGTRPKNLRKIKNVK
jgi:hypothetical protein